MDVEKAIADIRQDIEVTIDDLERLHKYMLSVNNDERRNNNCCMHIAIATDKARILLKSMEYAAQYGFDPEREEEEKPCRLCPYCALFPAECSGNKTRDCDRFIIAG